MIYPSAILTADWHIRDTTPFCRKDDFIATLWAKIEFIFKKAKEYKCPILIAGDLGDKPEWKNESLSRFIELVDEYNIKIFVVPGQHDLPNHNRTLFFKSGLCTLEEAKSISIIRKIPNSNNKTKFTLSGNWFGDNSHSFISSNSPSVLLIHKMVVNSKDLYPGQNADSAIAILKKNPQYRLIVCGDNHQGFSYEYKGRLLVNCGNILRDDIDQKQDRPCVWLWYSEHNIAKRLYLPISNEVFKEENEIKEIDDNLNSYVKKLQKEYSQGLSFQKNLESFLSQHKIGKNVCDKIWKSLGES